ATQKFVDAKVAAFKHDWAKHWRGELPTIGDYAVTPNEIMHKNLILFGDPQSNLTLAQILPKLPLKWTKDEIEFAGKKYKASEHVPVMIFPNPLNPSKYVVLNTDRKSTRLNSSHVESSYAVFCLKKKKKGDIT